MREDDQELGDAVRALDALGEKWYYIIRHDTPMEVECNLGRHSWPTDLYSCRPLIQGCGSTMAEAIRRAVALANQATDLVGGGVTA